jgi:hypothetical protein
MSKKSREKVVELLDNEPAEPHDAVAESESHMAEDLDDVNEETKSLAHVDSLDVLDLSAPCQPASDAPVKLLPSQPSHHMYQIGVMRPDGSGRCLIGVSPETCEHWLSMLNELTNARESYGNVRLKTGLRREGKGVSYLHSSGKSGYTLSSGSSGALVCVTFGDQADITWKDMYGCLQTLCNEYVKVG